MKTNPFIRQAALAALTASFMRRTGLACAALLLTLGQAVRAAPGDVDPTFGTGGIVVCNLPVATSVAVQSDGKILVAGKEWNGNDWDFAVLRFNADGTPDTSFSQDGKVTTFLGIGSDQALAVAVQGDGRILVAGQTHNGLNFDVALVRYLANGDLDQAFSIFGIVVQDIGGYDDCGCGLAVQSDGKILVTGFASNGADDDVILLRFNADGSLDPVFANNGIVITPVGNSHDRGWGVTVQLDGRILVAGSYHAGSDDIAVLRYFPTGFLDPGFSGDGMVTTQLGTADDVGRSVALQSDGKILVAGYFSTGSEWDFALVRLHADGTLDTSFSQDGKVATDFGGTNDYARSVVVQTNGRILVAGQAWSGATWDFALARYLPDGTLDPSFSGDGKVITDINCGAPDFGPAMALQSDGMILVTGPGSLQSALVRYQGDPPVPFHVRPGGTGDGSSWANAMGDVQQAIDACATVGGGRVWVAAGIYKPTSIPNPVTEGDPARRLHFSLRNGVKVYGGFPATGNPGLPERNPALHETTLSGDLSGNDTVLPNGLPDTATMGDNCYHVFYHPSTLALNAAAVLDGFTICGGYAGPDKTSVYLSSGGGMFCDAASPAIANCVFKLNSASFRGGGLFNDSSDPPLANCVMADNSAQYGGGLFNTYSSPTLVNCVLAENSARWDGGGISNTSSSPTLADCVLANNSAGNTGGGIGNSNSSSPILANTILWANGTTPVVDESSSASTLNYCITEWAWFGAGGHNSTADPQFVSLADPDGPDNRWRTADDGLRLQSGSPAIDTGSNALVPAGVTTDLLGNPRFIAVWALGVIVDRGAYEFSLSPAIEVRGNGLLVSDGDTTPDPADGTDFGGLAVGGLAVRTFTVTNPGTVALNLGAVTLGGAGADRFAVARQPVTPVAPGGSTTFQLAFEPNAVGQFNATVSLPNDAADNPFDFAIRGTGLAETETLPPILRQPEEGGATRSPVEVGFTLREAAAPGSVRLAFAGPVSSTLTLAGSLETEGFHQLSLTAGNLGASPGVAAVTGANALPDGIYTITLSCRDAANNPPASDTHANVTLDTVAPLIGGTFAPLSFPAGCLLPDYLGQAPVSDSGSGVFEFIQDPPEGTQTVLGPLTVTLTARDHAGNPATRILQLQITDPGTNQPPFGIQPFSAGFPENTPPNHLVATLTADDPDLGDSAVFTLVTGTGATHNALFRIVGNQLRLANPVDYETAPPNFSVRVRATDTGGAFYDQALFFQAANVNELPSFTAGPNRWDPAGTIGIQSAPAWAGAIDDGDSTVTQILDFQATIIADPDGVLNGPPNLDSFGGDLYYDLTGNNGTATVSITLTDDASIDDRTLTSAAQTFTIRVGGEPPELRLSIRREDQPAPALVLFWSAAPTDATVESSPDLAAPWTPVTLGIVETASMFEYRIPIPPVEPRRFFRLRR
ncbi:MAG: choice-of-anchor D domain-containing protein [Verrucomicrobia bacterium]|nr:choice-of-anchor D domain-containing protein [Verrucomicrobiota bacterium]